MFIPKDVLSIRDEGDQPPSPFSYFFPLLLIMIACGGYIYWRRSNGRTQSQATLPLNFPSRAPTGIRLSEEGPPATSFTHNNDSTDSLPSHALQEIPELHQPTPVSYKDHNPMPLPRLSSTSSNPNKSSSGILGIGNKRRSAKGKMRGPIEEDASDEEEDGQGGRGKFGLGDDVSSDSGGDDDLGPLGRK